MIRSVLCIDTKIAFSPILSKRITKKKPTDSTIVQSAGQSTINIFYKNSLELDVYTNSPCVVLTLVESAQAFSLYIMVAIE